MRLKLLFTTLCLVSFSLPARIFGNFIDSELFPLDGESNAPKAKVARKLPEAKQIADQMIVEFMRKRTIPAIVFGMSVRNITIHRSAQGLFDLENEAPADINGMFRMASVTKTLTSLFIGTLVEAGKLKYEDSIYKHLPAATLPPKFFNHTNVDITVGWLLSHMAGFHDPNISDSLDDLKSPKNCIEATKQFRNEPLYFKPGTDFEYSNYGFQILGAIIEHVTGSSSYAKVMDSFLRKIMPPSSETMIEQIGANHVIHHHPLPKYYKENNTTKATIPVGIVDDALQSMGIWASGGLISNVDDLLRYGNAILDIYHKRPNAILKKKTLLTMWTPRTLKAPNFPSHFRPGEYGYGWGVADVSKSANPTMKHRVYRFHPGGLFGVSTFLSVYPEEEIVVVTMANKGGIADLRSLCAELVETISDFVPKNKLRKAEN